MFDRILFILYVLCYIGITIGGAFIIGRENFEILFGLIIFLVGIQELQFIYKGVKQNDKNNL